VTTVFLSYRRNDAGYAGRLHDALREAYGEDAVFMDVDRLQPGDRFKVQIEEAIADASVLLVLIGRDWTTVQNPDSLRRLDDPHDFVVYEIETACARGVQIIPVLVGGASMPGPGDLPARIAVLRGLHAIELSDVRWTYDVARLIRALASMGAEPSRATSDFPRAVRHIADPLVAQARVALIDPRPLYRELRLDRFTGRQWLVEEVDAFLSEWPSGCFVLEGGPGIGKTTFLAWLARERGYAQHFVRLAAGHDDTSAALTNLAAQLVGEWQLDPPDGPDMRPDQFHALLEQAAQVRDQRHPARPIVIVIDGLNEAAPPPAGQNVLGLPRTLPEGVYLIVSQQPADIPLYIWPRPICPFSAADERQREDLRRYVHAAAERPGIDSALRAARLSSGELTDALLHSSGGVWLHAQLVLDEIERGERGADALDNLPFGLWQYYAEHWRRRRRDNESSRWESMELPLLATLAATREPLTPRILGTLAGVRDGDASAHIVDGWERFLHVTKNGEPRYRLYHESLRAFLSGEAPALHRGEQRIAEQMARATLRAHERIADLYVEAWGGFDRGLVAIRERREMEVDSGYGVRNLAAHLEAADRGEQLLELLRLTWPGTAGPTSAWYAAHTRHDGQAGFLADVERAWRLSEDASDQAIDSEAAAPTIGDEIGLALITASLNSLRTNLPPQLRAALVRNRLWTVTEAVADAVQIADPGERVGALISLAPELEEDQRAEMLDEALAATREISDEGFRGSALMKLASHLTPLRIDDALHIARTITDPETCAWTIMRLTTTLTSAGLDEVLELCCAIDDGFARVRALGGLAPRLDKKGIDTSLRSVLEIAEEGARAHGLEVLAEHLRRGQLDEALQAVSELSDEELRSDALSKLAPHLVDAQLERALECAGAIDAALPRLNAVGSLFPVVDRDLTDRAMELALTAASDVLEEPSTEKSADYGPDASIEPDGEYVYATAMTQLLPHVDGESLGVVEQTTRMLKNPLWRSKALRALSQRSEGERACDLLHEALAAARATAQPYWRGQSLAMLVPLFAANERVSLVKEALSAARSVVDMSSRVEALTAIGTQLGDEARDELLSEALTVARSIPEDWPRLTAVLALVPYLSGTALQRGLDDALATATSMVDDSRREDALEMVVSELADDDREAVAEAAFTAAFSMMRGSFEDDSHAALLKGGGIALALVAARAVGDPELRARALVAILPHVVPGERSRILAETVAASREISDTDSRADLLVAMTQLCTDSLPDLSEAALAAARDISEAGARREALDALAPYLDATQTEEALSAARQIRDDPAAVIAELASHAPARALECAIAAAHAIRDDGERAGALTALVPALAGHEREGVIDAALDGARAVSDEGTRAGALTALAAVLAGEARERVLAEGLAGARAISDEATRANALTQLAPLLGGEARELVLDEALTTARRISDGKRRVDLLTDLVPALDGEARKLAVAEALAAAARSTRFDLANTVGRLSVYLPAAERERALEDGLAVALGIDDDEGWLPERDRDPEELARTQALAALMPYLHGALHERALSKALATARAIENRSRRVEALAHVVPHVMDDARAQLLDEALQVLRAPIQSTWLATRVKMLEPGQDPNDAPTEFVQMVGVDVSEHHRANAIVELAPHLRDESLGQVITIVRDFRQPSLRAQVLEALATHGDDAKLIDSRIWRDLLHTAAPVGRPALQAVLPVVLRLTRGRIAQSDGWERTATWLTMVLTWWP
jgi:hypothetical protein